MLTGNEAFNSEIFNSFDSSVLSEARVTMRVEQKALAAEARTPALIVIVIVIVVITADHHHRQRHCQRHC